MNYGNGSIGFSNNPAPPPPAGLTGANNGLKVVATEVKLGGPLLANTNIDINNKLLSFSTDLIGNVPLFSLHDDGLSQDIEIGDVNEIYKGMWVSIYNNNNLREFAVITPLGKMLDLYEGPGQNKYQFGYDSLLMIDGTGKKISFQQNNLKYFELNIPGKVYTIGDLSGTGNGCYLSVNDNASSALINIPNGKIFLIADDGIFSINPDGGSSVGWLMGDKINPGVGLVLDTANYISIKINGTAYKLALVN